MSQYTQRSGLTRVKVFCDVQNVFHGARNYIEDEGIESKGIDYAKLKSFIMSTIDSLEDIDGEYEFKGYVFQTPDNRGVNLFAAIRKIGFELRSGRAHLEDDSSGSVSDKMQLDILNEASKCDILVIVSGSGVYEKALRAIRTSWDVKTYVVAFENTLHKVYLSPDHKGFLDGSILLGSEVLKSGGYEEKKRGVEKEEESGD